MRPDASENSQINPSTIVRAARAAGSQPHLASGFQGRCKIATLHADFGVIRGMSVEVPQHSFALILACLLDYFHERGHCRTIGVVRFVVRFNAEVKVGPIEQHLVSKEFPDAKEIRLLIQFDRVISEWITRAIIRAGRHRQTNHDCHNRYKRCDMHIQNALVSIRRARTDTSERLGRLDLDYSFIGLLKSSGSGVRAPAAAFPPAPNWGPEGGGSTIPTAAPLNAFAALPFMLPIVDVPSPKPATISEPVGVTQPATRRRRA